MGKAKLKPFDGAQEAGFDLDAEYEFMWLENWGGRFMVDLDPGPEVRAGFYSPAEFEATFDVIEE